MNAVQAKKAALESLKEMKLGMVDRFGQEMDELEKLGDLIHRLVAEVDEPDKMKARRTAKELCDLEYALTDDTQISETLLEALNVEEARSHEERLRLVR